LAAMFFSLFDADSGIEHCASYLSAVGYWSSSMGSLLIFIAFLLRLFVFLQ